MLEGTCWLPKKKESLPSKENCSWQACVCYMLARRLNKCIELFPGHFSLLLSRLHSAGLWKWKTGEKTKVPLCCASEKAAICGSLCFILEWLRKKIINTMKSKFLFEKKCKKTPFFSVFFFRLKTEIISAASTWATVPGNTAKRQEARCVAVVLVCMETCMHTYDGRKNHFCVDGSMRDAWMSPH